MPHNRSPKPGAPYYLPKYRYRTVVNFCFQYVELKNELNALDGWRGRQGNGMPSGGGISDPTASAAMRRAEISKKLDVIEKAVYRNSGEVLYPYMLKGVTDEDVTYKYLSTVMRIPLTHKQYSMLRRKIYYDISKHI